MATNSDKNTVKLTPAVNNPNNVEAKKYYIFNETGNIMIASTIEPGQPIEESVQKIFAEVSVFFAGMTRAITTTINPETQQPYSIYNYHALERIIGGSGLFIHVTEEDVTYETKKVGVDFSKELLESLLGLATGAGEMGFASAMMASIGKEGLRISTSESKSESKVGNIVFVCEYLLGMPLVNAIVVYADCKDHWTAIQTGPCFKEQSTTTNWTLHKDTYLFVTPTFIRDYASDLDSIRSDPNYVELINWLQGLLNRTPTANDVYDCTSGSLKRMDSGSALDPSRKYRIVGEFLPEKKVTLKFAFGDGIITGADWSSTEINFTVKGNQDKQASIEIHDADDNLVASTPGTYTIKSEKLLIYTFTPAENVMSITERQYGTSNDMHEIRFSRFTSCIGLIARNAKDVTGVHLGMMGEDNESYFDNNAAEEAIALLGDYQQVVVIGQTGMWSDNVNVQAAYQYLIAGLNNPRVRDRNDGTYGGRVANGNFQTYENGEYFNVQ